MLSFIMAANSQQCQILKNAGRPARHRKTPAIHTVIDILIIRLMLIISAGDSHFRHCTQHITAYIFLAESFAPLPPLYHY